MTLTTFFVSTTDESSKIKSFVCTAETEDEARRMIPISPLIEYTWGDNGELLEFDCEDAEWIPERMANWARNLSCVKVRVGNPAPKRATRGIDDRSIQRRFNSSFSKKREFPIGYKMGEMWGGYSYRPYILPESMYD